MPARFVAAFDPQAEVACRHGWPVNRRRLAGPHWPQWVPEQERLDVGVAFQVIGDRIVGRVVVGETEEVDLLGIVRPAIVPGCQYRPHDLGFAAQVEHDMPGDRRRRARRHRAAVVARQRVIQQAAECLQVAVDRPLGRVLVRLIGRRIGRSRRKRHRDGRDSLGGGGDRSGDEENGEGKGQTHVRDKGGDIFFGPWLSLQRWADSLRCAGLRSQSNSFNGKPKATASHTADAFGLPLNEDARSARTGCQEEV